MKKTLSMALALIISALPVSSALACGGDAMSDADIVTYAIQNHVFLGTWVSARTRRNQLEQSRAMQVGYGNAQMQMHSN